MGTTTGLLYMAIGSEDTEAVKNPDRNRPILLRMKIHSLNAGTWAINARSLFCTLALVLSYVRNFYKYAIGQNLVYFRRAAFALNEERFVSTNETSQLGEICVLGK
jgi:hypothetical protein